MKHPLLHLTEQCPLIAAVKDEEGLCKALEHDCKIIFLLYGDIVNITGIVHRIHEVGKIAVVHLDLISGLSTKEVAVDFLHQQVGANGIISTKHNLIRRGKELGMLTVLRVFVLDSMSLKNVEKSNQFAKPDLIEILPGVMPKIVKQLKSTVCVPIICGGLIADKEDVMDALGAGAIAVSTTNPSIWSL